MKTSFTRYQSIRSLIDSPEHLARINSVACEAFGIRHPTVDDAIALVEIVYGILPNPLEPIWTYTPETITEEVECWYRRQKRKR